MSTPKLRQVLRLDSIKLDRTYFTDEGYLVDHPIVTSVGIFEYTNPDGSIRRELRLPEHVFKTESLQSYKGKPIIITHDAGVVTKDNVEDETIGTILSEGYQDGNNVKAEIVIHNTDKLKECGLRELSLGYNLTLDETPGTWNDQPYDAVQTEITINHLALVANARAGEAARLNIDGQETKPILKGEKAVKQKTKRNDGDPMTPEELKAQIEAFAARKAQRATESAETGAQTDEDTPPVTPATEEKAGAANADAGETVQMVKDRRDRRDSQGDPETPENAMGVIAQQDEDIDSLLKVVETLMAKQDFDEADKAENSDECAEKNTDEDEKKMDGSDDKSGSLNMDSADKLVRQRIELVRIGDRLNLDGIDVMSVMDAKKAIVGKVNPQMRLDGKSGIYIDAAFDLAKQTLAQRKGTDSQRQQMFNVGAASVRMDCASSTAKTARERMIERQMNGGNK